MRDPLRDLRAIYTAAIDAVDPFSAVREHLRLEGSMLTIGGQGVPRRSFDIAHSEHIYVVGAGKATAPMAAAVEAIFGKKITAGCVCVKYGYTRDLKIIEIIEASHPLPDENGVRAARKIMELLEHAGENDLVISLISGGGSALLPWPAGAVTLEEKKATTQLLLKSGATIHEINAVRKHLSRVKGGNMARAAFPARVINLMISDVVGDDMDVIASGPFVPDRSSFADALAVLDRYARRGIVPAPVREHLERGARGFEQENPPFGDPLFEKVDNAIIASNFSACAAAKQKAESLGYRSMILSSLIEGDTGDAALWHCRIADEMMRSGNPLAPPACIISGGETTVQVRGTGLGGRNMEFALHAARHISGMERVLAASIGTDGTDGPTDAAGAIAMGDTVKGAAAKGIDINDYAANNDSYRFFEKTGGLIKTGPTNTNVMDIRIILAWD
jgi:hydroxypyruvate reductase